MNTQSVKKGTLYDQYMLYDDCTPGKHQEIETDISWITYLQNIYSEIVGRICRETGADIDCDHDLLVAEISIRLKEIIRF
jgi:hypothetical protein